MVARIQINREHAGQQDRVSHLKLAQIHIAQQLSNNDVTAQLLFTHPSLPSTLTLFHLAKVPYAQTQPPVLKKN
jgi:hypothetical protein